MFSVSNINYGVNDHKILDNINITFLPHKVTTLLGHNGCGKSTLVKLLSRQITAEGGEITLDGKPLQHYSQNELAKKVAYLPQHPPATDGVTIRELVQFGRYPWRGPLAKYTDDDKKIVDSAIRKVDLEHLSERFVATLSGGERQRAWVAMLLAQQTQVILLDEPISALDVAHQFELVQLINKLNKELNLTVIMVLHDINLASRFSDQIIALHSGKLIIQDTPENVLNTASLKQIYGIELGLITPANAEKPITYLL